LTIPIHKELLTLLLQSYEKGKSLSMQEIALYYTQDNDKSEAISAVCMDETVYVEPNQYLKDSVKKLVLLRLEKERELLKQRLMQYTQSQEYLSDEAVKELISNINTIDKKISSLKKD
jgi:hypothetical protein